MKFKCTLIRQTRHVPAAAGALSLTLFLAVISFSQVPKGAVVEPESGTVQNVEPLAERIRRLEAQLLLIQAELDRMKQTAAPKTSTSTAGIGGQQPAAVKGTSSAVEGAKPTPAEPQQKQPGIDLGSVRLTPYGTIYFNAFSNTGSVNNQDVPLFAVPSGQGGTSASVRQTRLGLRFEGARVGAAKLSGILEADFFGGFPNVSIGENFGVVRIRLANARLDWEKTSITVGQDWMPFAPVNPTSLAAAAIPQLAAAGNNWARLPQVRIDRKFGKGLSVSAAVLAPQTGDYPVASSFFLQNTTGAASRVPFFQSRLAYASTDWFDTGKNGSIGISAHYGRSRVASNSKDIDSVGIALDWNFHIHPRVTVSGEAFFGRNLAGFQGGAFQGINPDFSYVAGSMVAAGGARAIGTRGGWTQIGFTPEVFGDRWSIYGSVGIDDPRDSDLISVSRTNFRARNIAYAANTIFKVTPVFWLGAEVRRFETSYFNTGRRTSEHFNVGATYSF